jgi:hypothetical protein
VCAHKALGGYKEKQAVVSSSRSGLVLMTSFFLAFWFYLSLRAVARAMKARAKVRAKGKKKPNPTQPIEAFF